MGTRLGLDRFDRSTGRFTHIRTDGELDGCWTPLATRLGGQWFYSSLCRAFLVADRYSIADIANFPYVAMAHEGGFDMARFPNLLAWIERVRGQPGHVPLIEDDPRTETA